MPAILQMLLGATLISSAAIFVQLATVPPTVAGFWRMAFGGVFLMLWMRGRGLSLGGWSWRVQGMLLVSAAFFVADLWFWHRSIRWVGPGLSTLLANFQVFLMASAGVLLFGERLGWRFSAGLLLAFAGTAFLLLPNWDQWPEQFHVGVAFGFITAVCYAGFMLTLKRAQAMPGGPTPAASVAFICLWSCLLFLPVMALEGESMAIPDTHNLVVLLAYGLVAQAAGWIAIAGAMPRLTAGMIGLLLLAQPTSAYLLDALIFKLSLGAADMAGISLALFGIFLGATARTPAPGAVAPTR
ncbi:MAG: DMT family transporter [Ahniella sp.]|nr:DMT family transporter [Ahniella sp.]